MLGLAAVLVRSLVEVILRRRADLNAGGNRRQAEDDGNNKEKGSPSNTAQQQQHTTDTNSSLFAVTLFGLPLIGFPSALMTPVAFALRMAVRSGVRLVVLSDAGGDVAVGVIALFLAASYIAHVAYTVSPWCRPPAVRSFATEPPNDCLPQWHRRFEAVAGPSCVWLAGKSQKSSPRNKNVRETDGSALSPPLALEDSLEMALLPSPPVSPVTNNGGGRRSRAESVFGNETSANGAEIMMAQTSSVPNADAAATAWLARNGYYVAKARAFAWFGALQLLSTLVLKGLSAAQTKRSCLGRNIAALAVLASYAGAAAQAAPPARLEYRWVVAVRH